MLDKLEVIRTERATINLYDYRGWIEFTTFPTCHTTSILNRGAFRIWTCGGSSVEYKMRNIWDGAKSANGWFCTLADSLLSPVLYVEPNTRTSLNKNHCLHILILFIHNYEQTSAYICKQEGCTYSDSNWIFVNWIILRRGGGGVGYPIFHVE